MSNLPSNLSSVKFKCSAAALLAAATLYTNISNAETYFFQGTQSTHWLNPANWNTNQVPTSIDNANIGGSLFAQNDWVNLYANDTVANLTIFDGMILDTHNNNLIVSGTTTITGENHEVINNTNFAYPSRARVRQGGTFDTNTLNISDNASFELYQGGTLEVDILANINDTAAIRGNGNINLKGNGVRSLINDGIISTQAHLTPLTINQLGTGLIDLDGANGNGTLSAATSKIDGSAFSNIIINATQLADDFDGTMTIGNNGSITANLANGWTLGTGGKIQFHGGSYGAAKLKGSALNINGLIAVSHSAQIFNTTTINQNANVTLTPNDQLDLINASTINGGQFDIDTNATVNFLGNATINNGSTFNAQQDATISFYNPTTINGGSTFNLHDSAIVRFQDPTLFQGGTTNFNGGTASIKSTATVSDDTIINANIIDMDGNSNTVWNIYKNLTINANSVEYGGDNKFDGVINMNNPGILQIGSSTGGALTVNLPNNTPWELAGNINLVGSEPNGGPGTITPTMIAGSDLHITGLLSSTKNAAISAKIKLSGTIAIGDIDSNLTLNGGSILNPNIINGGQIILSGTIKANANHALFGHGTISQNTKINFKTGAELRAKNGTLHIYGNKIIHVGTLGTASPNGTLNVTGQWNTNVADLVQLKGGTLTGGHIINNNGIIEGHGIIASQGITNDTIIDAKVNTLIIDTINLPDLDGINGNGIIRAVHADLFIQDKLADAFEGTAEVASRKTMTFNDSWILDTNGALNLDGGPTQELRAMVNGSTQTLRGTVNANLEAHFDIITKFQNDAIINLNDNDDYLRLFQNAHIQKDATFQGQGTLVNTQNATLSSDNGALINVNLLNQGTLAPGNSPAILTVADFTQINTGTLAIEIGGLTPGDQHDQLISLTDLNLDGTLDLDLLAVYIPTAGHEFDILDWAGNLTGTFANLDLAALPINLTWDTSDLYTQGIVRIIEIPEPSTLALLLLSLTALKRKRN